MGPTPEAKTKRYHLSPKPSRQTQLSRTCNPNPACSSRDFEGLPEFEGHLANQGSGVGASGEEQKLIGVLSAACACAGFRVFGHARSFFQTSQQVTAGEFPEDPHNLNPKPKPACLGPTQIPQGGSA